MNGRAITMRMSRSRSDHVGKVAGGVLPSDCTPELYQAIFSASVYQLPRFIEPLWPLLTAAVALSFFSASAIVALRASHQVMRTCLSDSSS